MVQILVLVDHDQGVPNKVSNQILTAARNLGGEVSAAAFGPGAAGAGPRVGAYGAAKALVWDSPDATEYATEPQAAALVAALEASGADVLLYPADPFIGDVVARAAVRARAGVITSLTETDGVRSICRRLRIYRQPLIFLSPDNADRNRHRCKPFLEDFDMRFLGLCVLLKSPQKIGECDIHVPINSHRIYCNETQQQGNDQDGKVHFGVGQLLIPSE
jgi:hypothetical protein